MAIKWPPLNWLGRRASSSAAEQPAVQTGPAVPAAPPDPGWRALPPVQRTIGSIELTAPPSSFTSSLATAQDPALISANRPTLLTTGTPVSVLRMAETPSEPVAAQPTSSPAQSSRQWMPPLNIQRAALSAAEAAPQPAAPFMSSEAIEPYIATPSSSFVDAADPDEPRTVPVVDHVEPSLPSPAITGGPQAAVQRAVEPSAPTKPAQPDRPLAPGLPIVEPTPDIPVVSAVQRSAVDDAAPSAPATPDVPDSLRTVPVVEFSPSGGAPLSTVAEATLSAAPVIDIGARPASPSHDAPVSAASSRVGVQRAADDPVPAGSTPSRFANPVPPIRTATTSDSTENILQRSVVGDTERPQLGQPVATSATPVPVQRVAVAAESAGAGGAPLPVVAEPLMSYVGGSAPRGFEPMSGGRVVGALQRAMAVGPGEAAIGIRSAADDSPRTSPTSFAAEREFPGAASAAFGERAEVQRTSAGSSTGEAAHSFIATPAPAAGGEGPPWTPTVFEARTARPDTPTVQRALQSGTLGSSAVTAATRGMPFGAAASSAQRTEVSETGSASPAPVIALPVVQRDLDAEPDSVPASFGTGTSVSPRPADGPPSPGRIVLLPPVRSDSAEPAGHPREVLADSSRPMSLQRMFGDFARPTPEPDVVAPRAAGEQVATQAVTFDGPAVQRAVDSDPDSMPIAQALSEQTAPEQAPSAPAGAAPAAAGAAAPASADVDALVGRLYEPLAARLRAELWLDRERAGALMSLHR